LIGGLDVIKGLVADNKFKELLPKDSVSYDPKRRLDRVLKKSTVSSIYKYYIEYDL
jgi:hypothetical protein